MRTKPAPSRPGISQSRMTTSGADACGSASRPAGAVRRLVDRRARRCSAAGCARPCACNARRRRPGPWRRRSASASCFVSVDIGGPHCAPQANATATLQHKDVAVRLKPIAFNCVDPVRFRKPWARSGAPTAASAHEARQARCAARGVACRPSLLRRHSTSSALLRPFVLDQIAHLGAGEIAAEARPEIVHALRVAEDALDARAIGAHQAPRMRLGEERPAAAASRPPARRRRRPENRRRAAASRRSRPAARRRNARAAPSPPRPAGGRW